jgi:hypothetical protein
LRVDKRRLVTLGRGSAVPVFDDGVRAVFVRIRRALADLFAAVGADASSGLGLARRFGVDKNLAWKIAKVVSADDVYGTVPNLPGRAGLEIFLRSVAKAGAPAASIDEVRLALRDLEHLMELHSGDRDTFETMLGHLPQARNQRAAEGYRRLAFRGNRAVWGVHARVQLSLHFVAPSQDARVLDLAIVSGFVDFRRLREDAPWAIATLRRVADDGTPRVINAPIPIDPEFSRIETAPLIGAVCSQPVPNLRVVPRPGGVLRYEIPEGPVGRTAAVTCIAGWYYPQTASRYRTREDSLGVHFASLTTPVELLFHDVYIHRDLANAIPPRLRLYSQLPGGPVYPADGLRASSLPLYDQMLDLGHPPSLVTPEVPTYPRIIAAVCERLGWRLEQFHAFRLKLPYPPIPTAAAYEYELEATPDE